MRGTWEGSGTWKSSGPDGRAVLAVIAVVVLLGSGAASAIASAIVTVLIIIGSLIGLAILACIAWLAYRTRQGRAGRPAAARPVYRLPSGARPGLEALQSRGIEPPREVHIHIHVADATQAAAIIRTAIPGRPGDAITEGEV